MTRVRWIPVVLWAAIILTGTSVPSVPSLALGSGEVTHAYLGVGVEPAEGGVAISQVKPGTPAADAGLAVCLARL